MEIQELIQRFSSSTDRQCKAIFSTIFIIGNRLQTLFDHNIPEITLKQFMLLSVIRQPKEPLTFTESGKLLGCSRQNIKKLAYALEKKGFVDVKKKENDIRAFQICPTKKCGQYFETVFFSYQKDLNHLFEIYTDEEIQQLFRLMMKLYDGTDHLEQKLRKEKTREKKQLSLQKGDAHE